jgi:uncharacterized protein
VTSTARLRIRGITCESCAGRVEAALRVLPGVARVSVSLAAATAIVEYDPHRTDLEQMRKAIAANGYAAGPSSARSAVLTVTAGLLLVGGWLLAGRLGAFSIIPRIPSPLNYGMLFVAGLLTGVHCIAMCGGINLSQSMKGAPPGEGTAGLLPAFLYTGGRVISYTIIGALVGGLGSIISFSPRARSALTGAAGLFMVITSLSVLGVFRLPVVARPLGPFGRLISAVRGRGPLLVGLLNGLMPCGPLQTMQLYALGTGSPVQGGLTMLLFCLGTVPLTFTLGAASGLMAKRFARRLVRAGAVLVLFLGVVTVGRGLSLAGISFGEGGGIPVAAVAGGVQTFRMELRPDAYERFAVQSGLPLRWHIWATPGTLNACNETIEVPSYGIRKTLAPGDNLITFTPTEGPAIAYTCWMGMITSSITVMPSRRGSVAEAFGWTGRSEAPAPSAGPPACPADASYEPGGAADTSSPDDCAVAVIREGVQRVRVRVTAGGYFPAVIVLQRGLKAVITFVPESSPACDRIVSFPEYRGRLDLSKGSAVAVVPVVTRDFTFSCGIGVLHGVAKVLSDLKKVDQGATRKALFSSLAPARPIPGSDKCCGD